jgi:hypothetical protein
MLYLTSLNIQHLRKAFIGNHAMQKSIENILLHKGQRSRIKDLLQNRFVLLQPARFKISPVLPRPLLLQHTRRARLGYHKNDDSAIQTKVTGKAFHRVKSAR